MAESAITTDVNVKCDTSELDDLKGIFPTLDNIVDDLKSRLNTACGNLAQRVAIQLLQYEQMEFSYHKHPYAKGVGENSFYAKDNGDNSWTVDNSAENNGFPYMVTEELGDNPGRKLSPHPFAAPAREVVKDEVEDMFKEVWG